jgi:hypothetical protein
MKNILKLMTLLLLSYNTQSYAVSNATHFTVVVQATGSTCNNGSTTDPIVTISAVNDTNVVQMSYINFNSPITITTSDGHGDFSAASAHGTLTPGAADSGSATYLYKPIEDKGVVSFYLKNSHSDSLTISANGINMTGTSTSIQYGTNEYVITPNAVTIAGKPNTSSITLYTKDSVAGLCNPSTDYNGSKAVKAWLSVDPSDPGGLSPTLAGVTLPSAMPASSNLHLTFTNGVASAILNTTDVGKYAINLRDASSFSNSQNIDGSSSVLTVRPFGIALSNIKNGATNNPGITTATGTIFQRAGLPFSVTATGYLWNSVSDVNSDGVPDAGATYANLISGGVTPHFAWDTTLTTNTPFYPATPTDSPAGTGFAGTLANATIPKASFASGVGTTTTVNYSEVGSFSLSGIAANYLNTAGATVSVFNPTVVGRFIPDHFVVSSTGITNRSDLSCSPVSSFNYMDENMRSYISITAQNAANTTTQNYVGSYAKFPNTIPNWNLQSINSGNKLTARTDGLTPNGSFVSGVYTGYIDFYLARLVNPDGPYNNLQVGIAPVDTDGVLTTGLNLNVLGTNVYQIGTTSVLSGRLHMYNNSGSDLLPLGVRMAIENYNGTSFVVNTADNCTSLSQSNFSLSNFSQNLQSNEVNVIYSTNFTNGINTVTLSKPSGGDGLYDGSTNLTYNLTADGKTYLQGKWTGISNTNPTAKLTLAKPNLMGNKVLNFYEQY